MRSCDHRYTFLSLFTVSFFCFCFFNSYFFPIKSQFFARTTLAFAYLRSLRIITARSLPFTLTLSAPTYFFFARDSQYSTILYVHIRMFFRPPLSLLFCLHSPVSYFSGMLQRFFVRYRFTIFSLAVRSLRGVQGVAPN